MLPHSKRGSEHPGPLPTMPLSKEQETHGPRGCAHPSSCSSLLRSYCGSRDPRTHRPSSTRPASTRERLHQLCPGLSILLRGQGVALCRRCGWVADRGVTGSRLCRQGSYRERAERSRASGGVDTSDPCGSHGGQRLSACPTTGPSSLPPVFNLLRLIAYSNSFSVGYRACEKPNDRPTPSICGGGGSRAWAALPASLDPRRDGACAPPRLR